MMTDDLGTEGHGLKMKKQRSAAEGKANVQ